MRRYLSSPSIGLFLLVSASLLNSQTTNVTTWRYDNGRAGANTHETVLTTANVAKTTFGKICSAVTDGAINAEPLVVTGVQLKVGGKISTHNVAYVATENDTVYAYDANNCALLKKASMVPLVKGCVMGTTCEQPVECHSVGGGGCQTIAPTVGILGTPVIDATPGGPNGTTGTIYVEAETQVGAGKAISAWKHRIHALDITTLLEKPGSPVLVKGKYGPLTFTPQWQIQRSGLLLLKGVGPGGSNVVYASFSLMDGSPSTLGLKPPGWIVGYDTTNLSAQPAGMPYFFSPTPNGVGPDGPGGGIWQAGAGLSAGLASATDPTPYLYVGTGDGTFDANTGGQDYADSFVKLTPSLMVTGYFTRADEAMYQASNHDYGAGGMMLVPDNTFSKFPYLSINGGKDGNLYVVDRGTPGGFNGVSNTNVQTFAGSFPFLSTPAYWNGHLYNAILGGVLKSWQMSNTCNPGPICSTGIRFSNVKFIVGANPAVSSNGTTAGTGVVWAIATFNQINGGVPAVLYAFDAVTMTELYDTSQCGTLDTAGLAQKFTVPTVANGNVYIGTQGEFDVYGKLPTARTCP
jgi:hypothetical protein